MRTTVTVDESTHTAMAWLRDHRGLSASAILQIAVRDRMEHEGLVVHDGKGTPPARRAALMAASTRVRGEAPARFLRRAGGGG